MGRKIIKNKGVRKRMEKAQKPRKVKAKTINRIEDKYYTKPHVAEQCLDMLMKKSVIKDSTLWIEPSVGIGSFANALKTKLTNNMFKLITIDVDKNVNADVCTDYITWLNPEGGG